MSKAFEKVRQEGFQEGLVEVALRMLATGRYALEEIVEITGLSPDKVKALRDGQLV